MMASLYKKLSQMVCALSCALAAGAHAHVVVVVAASNPVASLQGDQVADIFLGRALTFPDGRRAVPLDLVEGQPARDEFHRRVTAMSAAQLKAYWSKLIFTGRGTPPREVVTPAAMKKLIAENPAYIGYIDDAEVDGSLRIVHVPK